ncbi:hypothetical protein D3C81_1663730 [compost metagenome]
MELVQQVARRQGHFVELGAVPAVEQDAAAARVFVDGVDALANLVDGLVQHHKGFAVFFSFGNLLEALALRQFDRGRVAQRDTLVGRPLAPLHAVDLAEVVMPLAERVGQPLGVFVGVLVPDLAAQFTELAGILHATQEADHFTDGRLERQLAGGDGRKAFLQVEAQHGARQADGADTGTVTLQGAVFDDVADQI